MMLSVPNSIDAMRAELGALAGMSKDTAQGPPGKFYTDADYFRFEQEHLLTRGWHCVGRADEYVKVGDFQAFDLLGEPVLVVRDKSGINAFANLCKHRGMPVAANSGTSRVFVCPYHAWTYGTDGKLIKAPMMDHHTAFDPKTCKLNAYACEERFGFVYVNLTDKPTPIDTQLAGLGELLAPYEPENYKIQHVAIEHWKCNWKALVENFMEGYHLSVLHPKTLHGYTPTRLCEKGPVGPGFTSYIANYPDDIPSRGNGAQALTEQQRHSSFLFAAYPGQVASISASLFVSLSIKPLAVDEIEVRWTLSTYGDDLLQSTIDQRIELWTEVNREDREKVEAMQKALGSKHALGGPLAGDDHEGTVRDFIRWQAKSLETYQG